eukprot:GHVS01066230.1.p1 GENE.GHVS01066230.1~~GHVS01066230.1.p1  ORF type:complete len:621 (-),score=50.75 GHVS01066230.1:1329-3191(-)
MRCRASRYWFGEAEEQRLHSRLLTAERCLYPSLGDPPPLDWDRGAKKRKRWWEETVEGGAAARQIEESTLWAYAPSFSCMAPQDVIDCAHVMQTSNVASSEPIGTPQASISRRTSKESSSHKAENLGSPRNWQWGSCAGLLMPCKTLASVRNIHRSPSLSEVLCDQAGGQESEHQKGIHTLVLWKVLVYLEVREVYALSGVDKRIRNSLLIPSTTAESGSPRNSLELPFWRSSLRWHRSIVPTAVGHTAMPGTVPSSPATAAAATVEPIGSITAATAGATAGANGGSTAAAPGAAFYSTGGETGAPLISGAEVRVGGSSEAEGGGVRAKVVRGRKALACATLCYTTELYNVGLHLEMLTCIDLANEPVGDLPARLISAHLPFMPSLTSIRLTQLCMSSWAGRLLAHCLQQDYARGVQHLEITRNWLFDESAQSMVDLITCNHPGARLRSLKLNDVRFSDASCAALLQAVASNTHLRSLQLNDHVLTTNGSIADCLSTNTVLEELSLSGMCLGDDAMASVSRGLRSNRSLQVLTLRYNEIGQQGCEYLAESLATNQSLRRLDIYWNHVELPGAEALLKAIEGNSHSLCSSICFSGNRLPNDFLDDVKKGFGYALGRLVHNR